jgi:hypothetical protein
MDIDGYCDSVSGGDQPSNPWSWSESLVLCSMAKQVTEYASEVGTERLWKN